MKKVSKFLLRENVEVLNEQEMKLLLGGVTYRCCCGMGENISCLYATADETDDVMNALTDLCPNGMGGCFLV